MSPFRFVRLTNEMRAAAALMVAVALFGLFYLGSRPGAGSLFPPPWDKLAHFVVYGGLGGLLVVTSGNRYPWVMALACAAIGALDEWHQLYLPGRHADVFDFITDVAAISIAVPITTMTVRKQD